jgi:hypothetical protein
VARRTIVSFLVTPLLGVLMAGCGGQHKADARVAGVVEVCGAPLLGERYSCIRQSGSVAVFGPGGRRIAQERLSHGRYSFRLPPGTYEVVARTPAKGPFTFKHAAKAQSERTTIVNFVLEAS